MTSSVTQVFVKIFFRRVTSHDRFVEMVLARFKTIVAAWKHTADVLLFSLSHFVFHSCFSYLVHLCDKDQGRPVMFVNACVLAI